MNPKTIVWIARSLDRIAKALTLIATSDLVNLDLDSRSVANLREGITTAPNADASSLYREVFWSKADPAEAAAINGPIVD